MVCLCIITLPVHLSLSLLSLKHIYHYDNVRGKQIGIPETDGQAHASVSMDSHHSHL